MASSLGHRRCVSPPDLHRREGLVGEFSDKLAPKIDPSLRHLAPMHIPPPAAASGSLELPAPPPPYAHAVPCHVSLLRC
jgi:hypothetical protein